MEPRAATRHHSFRSVFVLIALLLLNGAVVSVAAAWFFAPSFRLDVGEEHLVHKTESGVLFTRPAIGITTNRLHDRANEPLSTTQVAEDTFHRLEALRMEDTDEVLEWRAGWPLHCMSGYQLKCDFPNRTTGEFVQHQEGIIGVQIPAVLSSVYDSKDFLILPTHPIWRNLILNTLIFATALAVLAFAVPYCRSLILSRRANKGVCQRCRHTLDPARRSATCPECGGEQNTTVTYGIRRWSIRYSCPLTIVLVALTAVLVLARLESPLWTPLHAAASTGDLDEIRSLLQDGAHVDEALFVEGYDFSFTPLMAASLFGNNDVVQLLLDEGADVSCGIDDRTLAASRLLMLASHGFSHDLVLRWLNEGADPWMATLKGFYYRPIVIAANSAPFEVVCAMYERPCLLDSTTRDRVESWLLRQSVNNADTRVVHFFEGNSTDSACGTFVPSDQELADMLDELLSETFFFSDIANSNPQAIPRVVRFIERGLLDSISDLQRADFMFMLATGLYPDILNAILDNGVDPHMTDEDGRNFWFFAPRGGPHPNQKNAAETWQRLLDLGVDPLQPDNTGETARQFVANESGVLNLDVPLVKFLQQLEDERDADH